MLDEVINEKAIYFFATSKVIGAVNKEEGEIFGRISGIPLGFIKKKALELKDLMYWSILRFFWIKRSKTEKAKWSSKWKQEKKKKKKRIITIPFKLIY